MSTRKITKTNGDWIEKLSKVVYVSFIPLMLVNMDKIDRLKDKVNDNISALARQVSKVESVVTEHERNTATMSKLRWRIHHVGKLKDCTGCHEGGLITLTPEKVMQK